jgi:hypothetical protein
MLNFDQAMLNFDTVKTMGPPAASYVEAAHW